jgi:hypothetical protein
MRTFYAQRALECSIIALAALLVRFVQTGRRLLFQNARAI